MVKIFELGSNLTSAPIPEAASSVIMRFPDASNSTSDGSLKKSAFGAAGVKTV